MPTTTSRRLLAALVVSCLSLSAISRADTAELEKGFADPPADTRPACYWYWMSDHVSHDGITKDLEAMARVGIGEAFIGNIDVGGARGPVKVLTEPSFEAMAHAMREGHRTGVRVGMFNCPGWSQSGGPWVTPAQTMRYVVGAQTRVTGPARFSKKLETPHALFQDVAVLAYPEPKHDRETLARRKPAVQSSVPTTQPTTQPARGHASDGTIALTIAAQPAAAPPVTVDLRTNEPFTARSLSLVPGPQRFAMRCELLAEDAEGNMVPLEAFNADRSADNINVGPMTHGPVMIAFPAVTSRHFQLRFKPLADGAAMPILDIADVQISQAARLERVIEKQLGKVHPTPQPTWESYLWPTQAEPEEPGLAVDPQAVRNISSQLQPDGTLTWDVPAGDWIIERLGMTPTGAKNSPSSPEGTGYEVDKMNRAHLAEHYDAFVGKVMARLSPEAIKSAGHVIADSYEMGSQNWTDGFDQTFKARYGYDPLPWLPVLGGRLVGSATQSERFLWDLRRLIADRIATEYVGGMRDQLAGKGLRLWLENYGHWGFPSEFMKYGGESPDIGGEFWIGPGGNTELGGTEVRAAASAAHGYGKNSVSAEAFTSATAGFQRAPWDLKTRGDWAMTEGVNHFVLHVYIHQAYDDKQPGVNAWFGTEFNRKNTWFEASRGWIDYLRRSNFLLKQGRYAADVAYFIGEDAPKMTGTMQPALPAGYSYDFINAELIHRATVRDGSLVLPSGMSYRLLVLPPQTTMRPELLDKLRELVAAGGAIFGPAPASSPSLQEFPSADERVRQVASELWQDCDGTTKTHVTYGKGHVFNAAALQPALDLLQVPAAVTGLAKSMLWTHRTDANFDIYFISNQSDEAQTASASFRGVGRQPEVWNAVTTERRDLPQFVQREGRTEVPLTLEARESLFIIFARPASTAPTTPPNFPPLRTLQTIDGPWIVSFNDSKGGPASVVFDQLGDWTQRPEPSIKHYSGTATYRRTFDAAGLKPASPLFLDIGPINGIARVRLNGTDVGSIWCAPWSVNIGAALKPAGNELEIEVTNNWINRLLFDATRAAHERATWTLVPPNVTGAKPQPSGIIGPVVLRTR